MQLIKWWRDASSKLQYPASPNVSIILLNNLMFFLYQVQGSWLKRNLGRRKRKFFPDLWVTPKKYFATTQFCKNRIIGYPYSFALERALRFHCPSLLRCIGGGPAVEQMGEKIPWVLTLACFFLYMWGGTSAKRILHWSRVPLLTLMNPAGGVLLPYWSELNLWTWPLG